MFSGSRGCNLLHYVSILVPVIVSMPKFGKVAIDSVIIKSVSAAVLCFTICMDFSKSNNILCSLINWFLACVVIEQVLNVLCLFLYDISFTVYESSVLLYNHEMALTCSHTDRIKLVQIMFSRNHLLSSTVNDGKCTLAIRLMPDENMVYCFKLYYLIFTLSTLMIYFITVTAQLSRFLIIEYLSFFVFFNVGRVSII